MATPAQTAFQVQQLNARRGSSTGIEPNTPTGIGTTGQRPPPTGIEPAAVAPPGIQPVAQRTPPSNIGPVTVAPTGIEPPCGMLLAGQQLPPTGICLAARWVVRSGETRDQRA